MGTWSGKSCKDCGKVLTDERFEQNLGYCATCKGKPKEFSITKEGLNKVISWRCKACNHKIRIIKVYREDKNWDVFECMGCGEIWVTLEDLQSKNN